ncbi:MAG: radical SAM protein [Candidatus Cloacimonadales bacterium]|jgi:DNA repair photolyase|nr:radical SAM protein [Acholeplasmataceae bacterium]MDX9977619.1 radical SAM protein [Candidatus Cloacimonadales bacterium]
MKTTQRKTLLYKTKVEYGDYTINHVLGCSHGCLYPCYAFMLAKRFGKVKTYEDWCEPVIVENSINLLKKEIPKLKNKINSVHLSFTTDPFMVGYPEVTELSLKIIQFLNENNIKITALTKGILPSDLKKFSNCNEYGITLISLNEDFRKEIEPFSAKYSDRIISLKNLHNSGFKTWVSIEPYPTPNIINQNFEDILNSIDFVDKIIFGRLHYNGKVSKYNDYQNYYNKLADLTIEFCKSKKIICHIKNKTIIR